MIVILSLSFCACLPSVWLLCLCLYLFIFWHILALLKADVTIQRQVHSSVHRYVGSVNSVIRFSSLCSCDFVLFFVWMSIFPPVVVCLASLFHCPPLSVCSEKVSVCLIIQYVPNSLLYLRCSDLLGCAAASRPAPLAFGVIAFEATARSFFVLASGVV